REDLTTKDMKVHKGIRLSGKDAWIYALTSACALARRSAYSGKVFASSSTCLRIFSKVAASVRLWRASEIQRPTCRISASFIPRVVNAGVPIRMPLGFRGGFVSKGMAFLLTVIPAWRSEEHTPELQS